MKRKISFFLIMVMIFSSVFASGLTMPVFADTVDEFAWNFSELAVGYPIGDNIEAETQNTRGQGQKFFANVEHRAFTEVHSAGAFGTNSETAANILIDNQSNKWCQGVNVNTAWFILDAGAGVKAKSYAIRGANDDMSYASIRPLHTWTVQGSDSASGPWTTVSSPGAQGTGWTSNYQLRIFEFDSAAIPAEGYRYYRLQISRYGNTTAGTALGTSNGTMQFSYFGLVTDYDIVGSDDETSYLMSQIASGVSASWAGSRTTMNGPNVLRVGGTIVSGDSSTVSDAKSYTTIKNGLNIEIHPNTKFSYMFAPEGRTSVLLDNDYDYKYHGHHMSIDLLMTNKDGSDPVRLKDVAGATDQYGIGMNPKAQGQGKVNKTYQWNYIECELGKYPNLVGKVVTDIIVGFEMDDADAGYKAAASFDDIKIFRRDWDHSTTELADYVDIRQGTNSSGNATGAIPAIVSVPYASQYWAPTTIGRNEANKYNWANSTMHGITTSHLASRHMGERLTYLFMANSVLTDANANNTNVNDAVANSAAGFKHENESAYYNYHYAVTFNEDDAKAPGVKMEVTPTLWGAVLRFTFPKGAPARNILFDNPHRATNNDDGKMAWNPGDWTFSGWIQNGGDSGSSTSGNSSLRRKYMYGQFSATPSNFYIPSDRLLRSMASFPELENGPDGSTVIEMRVAMSWISSSQAKKNFSMELIGSDKDAPVPSNNWAITEGKWFENIKEESKKLWNKKLGAVKIEDDVANYWQFSNFYSKLARFQLFPSTLSEYTGIGETGYQYASPYSGTNANPTIVDGHFIYNEGWWDTFKSKWPLLSFLYPTESEDLTDGIIQHYTDLDGRAIRTEVIDGSTTNTIKIPAHASGHSVPRWINPGGNNMMTGTSSDAIISDNYTNGIGFKNVMDGYFSWIKNSAATTPNTTYGGRAGVHQGTFNGYSSTTSRTDGGDNSLTWSLEGFANDAAQVYMLRKMIENVDDIADEDGKIEGLSKDYWVERWAEEAIYYESRAKNYSLLFNPAKTGWLRSRNEDGSWYVEDVDYNPLNWYHGHVEDNAWPYRFLVPQDGRGLANLFGMANGIPGPEALRKVLDDGFNAEGTDMDIMNNASHEAHEKREIKMGQFGLSNQPSYHMPWMYLHSDRPYMTQYWTRTALLRAFSGEAIGYGYLGEEDNGAYASWYVWAALGLYPLDLGSGQVVIGSPAFRNITITDDTGKQIKIKANNNSYDNIYIQSIKFNNQSYDKPYFELSDLSDGAEIVYEMGNTPKADLYNGNTPPSLTDHDGTPDIMMDLTYPGIPISDMQNPLPNDLDTAAVFVEGISATGSTGAPKLFNNTAGGTLNNPSTNTVNDNAVFSQTTATIVYYDPIATKVEMYTLTTPYYANNAIPANIPSYPKSWILSGSNDGVIWKELDKREGETFEWRKYTRPFAVPADKQGEYKFYKLEITEASSENNLALSQLEFLAAQYANVSKKALLSVIEEAENKLETDTQDGIMYAQDTVDALNAKLDIAKAFYDDDTSVTGKEIQEMIDDVKAGINGLIAVRNSWELISAPDFNEASWRITTFTETSARGYRYVNNTVAGHWFKYKNVDFGNGDFEFPTIYLNYGLFPGYAPSDSNMSFEVYIDEYIPGETDNLIAVIETPGTGGTSTAPTFNYASADVIDENLPEDFAWEGLHDLIFVARGATGVPSSDNRYARYTAGNVMDIKFDRVEKSLHIKNIDFTSDGNPVTNLEQAAGKTVEATVTVFNNVDQEADALLIMAAYDDLTGRLVSIANSTAQHFDAFEEKDYEFSFEVPQDPEGLSYYIYLWDGQTYRPYTAKFKAFN